MALKEVAKNVVSKIGEKSPELLLGTGIAGMVGACYLSSRAGAEAERRKEELLDERVTNKEKFKLLGSIYWKPITAMIFGVGCTLGSYSKLTARSSALAAMYAMSETAREEYRSKVIEKLGGEKDEEIRKEIVKAHINDSADTVGVLSESSIPGDGPDLCYDNLGGHYFWSSIDRINTGVAKLNRRLDTEEFIQCNEYFYEFGLPQIKLGQYLGWSRRNEDIEFYFDSIIDKNGRAVIVVDCYTEPTTKY